MKSLIEKNAARIIITTLIALVIIGIVIGAPTNNPGHSILSLGDPNYYFAEDMWTNASGDDRKFLTLELPSSTNYVGRLDIRPGDNDGVIIRQGGDYGHRDPGLFLRTFSDHARLNFYPGVVNTTPNQLSIYADQVRVNSPAEFCIGGSSSCFTSSALSCTSDSAIVSRLYMGGNEGDPDGVGGCLGAATTACANTFCASRFYNGAFSQGTWRSGGWMIWIDCYKYDVISICSRGS